MKNFLPSIFWLFIIIFLIIKITKDKDKFKGNLPPVNGTDEPSFKAAKKHPLFKRKNHNNFSFSPEQVGKAGESAVSSVLAGYRKHSEAYYFDNVTLHFNDGTTQIDHILITKKVILIIETKNWAGWIFGKKEDSVWTQIVGKNKMVLQNPLRQNHKHCLAVLFLLPFIPKGFIRSIVVLTGNSIFKTEHPNSVVHLNELEHILKRLDFGTISNDDFYRAIGVIEYFRLERSEQTDKQHKEYLENKFSNYSVYMDGEYLHRRKKYWYRNRYY